MENFGPDQKITDQFASIDVLFFGGMWILVYEVIYLWIFRMGAADSGRGL